MFHFFGLFQTVLMVHKRARILQLADETAAARKEEIQQNPIEELLIGQGGGDGLVTWDRGHIGLLPTDLLQVYQYFLVLVPADMLEPDGTSLMGSGTLSHLLRIIWMR